MNNILNVPLDFQDNLFSLQEKEEEINNKLYHGYFIFNNKIYNEQCEEVFYGSGELSN